MPPNRKSDDSDLSLLAQALRRRLWVIGVCFAVSTLIAIVFTVRAEKEYSATAALLLRPVTALEPQRVVDTNLQLLALPALAEATADSLGTVSKEEVELAVQAGQQGESDILQVKATAGSPALAAEIANTFADEFIKFREGEKDDRVEGGEVELIERAMPDDEPVAPNATQNVVFGALIGLALGFGLALLLEQVDRRVKRQEDVADATGLPLLSQIPKRSAFSQEGLSGGQISPAEIEIFQLLRANLRYFNVRKSVNSVLVTSAVPGEGKSLVALGLTLAAATSGEKALLIEADLRDPEIGRVLKRPAPEGLSLGLATGSATLKQLVTRVAAADLSHAGSDATLDVILAGAVPPNPVELIESTGMTALLAEAEEAYDLVVIDTPPVLVVSDAIPLVSQVSGVLAVTGLGVSTKSSAAELALQLERLQAPVLGLVVNFTSGAGRSFNGYGYGRPPEVPMMKARKRSRPRRSSAPSGE